MSGQFITDDIDSMFNTDEFAEVFNHVNGAVDENLNVLFDDDRIIVLNGIESSSPVIMLKTADMTNVDRSSVFTRSADSEVYYPAEIGKDEAGTTLIRLSKNRP